MRPVVVDEVLPDCLGVATPRDRLFDQLAVRLARARVRARRRGAHARECFATGRIRRAEVGGRGDCGANGNNIVSIIAQVLTNLSVSLMRCCVKIKERHRGCCIRRTRLLLSRCDVTVTAPVHGVPPAVTGMQCVCAVSRVQQVENGGHLAKLRRVWRLHRMWTYVLGVAKHDAPACNAHPYNGRMWRAAA